MDSANMECDMNHRLILISFGLLIMTSCVVESSESSSSSSGYYDESSSYEEEGFFEEEVFEEEVFEEETTSTTTTTAVDNEGLITCRELGTCFVCEYSGCDASSSNCVPSTNPALDCGEDNVEPFAGLCVETGDLCATSSHCCEGSCVDYQCVR